MEEEEEEEDRESFSEKSNLDPREVRRGLLAANTLHSETNGGFVCLSKNWKLMCHCMRKKCINR